ncbi:DUF1097 domain-containing protein [Azotobacter armeniacus]
MPYTLVPDHFKVTAGESAVAILAATVSALHVEVPVWAMFIGWIAFFSRGGTVRHGLINLACVLVGLAIGMLGGAASAALMPHFGALTTSLVVFAVALVVLSLRLLPVFNNLLCFFLGLVCYFASHLPPSPATFSELGLATTLGALAALLASRVQQRWSGQPAGEARQ